MKVFSGNGSFVLEPGVGIIVPGFPLVWQISRNANQFPQTPQTVLLTERVGKKTNNRRLFKNVDHDKPRKRPIGFRLFVPGHTMAGDLLVVDWVDKNCAAARHATPTELHMFQQTTRRRQSEAA
jgi:hypothetical protein